MNKITIILGIMLVLTLVSCDNYDPAINSVENSSQITSDDKSSNGSEQETNIGLSTDSNQESVDASIFNIDTATEIEELLYVASEATYETIDEDVSIDKVYHSPGRTISVKDKITDEGFNHDREYYYEGEFLWKYNIFYKKLPLDNNLITKPIWINEDTFLLSELDYDFERVDNLVVNTMASNVTNRPTLENITNIRGFSRNVDMTQLVLNIDSANRTDDLSGLIIYDVKTDSVVNLFDTTFNDRNRHYNNPDRITPEVTNFEFVENLRQNLVWGKDNNIYYTDAVLTDNYVSRVDRINIESRKSETLLNNAYILNESPNKRYIVVNDESSRKTVIWDLEQNKQFKLDYARDFEWNKDSMCGLYTPVDKKNEIHRFEIIGDNIEINTFNIEELLDKNMKVTNLCFNEQNNILFDILVYEYSEKEEIEYFTQVITYKLSYK